MRRTAKTVTFLGLILMVSAVLCTTLPVHAQTDKRIADGVYIRNIPVGGMTEQEAETAIHNYVRAAEEAMFTLKAGEHQVEAQATEFALEFPDMNVVSKALDVGRSGSIIKRYKDQKDLEHGKVVIDMALRADRGAAEAFLEEHAAELNEEAVDNGLVRENGSFRFIEGRQGVEINVAKSVAAIEEYISRWDGSDGTIELVAEVAQPRGTKEELSRVKDLLGDYTTNYGSSTQNRCDNIARAAELINGTVIYPGEQFSVAKTIGPLDASNGYELAGAYENGQTVQSYGGGVCQVSTTLYNTAILAEMEITERSNHSMIVNYVQPSMDAAIAGDYKDLKFVNNLNVPVYIEGYTSGKNLTFRIYGEETRPSNRKISFQSEVVSEQDPGTQFVATGDPIGHVSVAQGKHVGYVAQLWKIVTVDGVEQSREVFNKSTYRSSPKIVRVGTGTADPNAAAAMGAAIATGNEATIYGTIAACTAPQPEQPPQDGQPQDGQPQDQQPPQEQPQPEQPPQPSPEEQAVVGGEGQ